MLSVILVVIGYTFFSSTLQRQKKSDDNLKNNPKTIEEPNKENNDINDILKSKVSNLSS
jgi:hypothetical protein